MNKRILSIIAIFFFLFSTIIATEALSTVTINKAEKITSTKDAETGNSIISFTGDVSITVEKDGSKTTIIADLINYDRSKSMLYATGNVTMISESAGEEDEKITTDSVLFNTNTQEGVFYDGRITQEDQEALNIDTDSSLFITSNLFGRNEGGSVTFNKASLTFCNDENPHWQIKASRLWLLSGSEFAFFNALLYVGEIPIFYLPFFYYPKDEMIFNPVFGYRDRLGYYFQTTTYLIGRKPLDDVDEDSSLSFLKNTTLKKQEQQGLFLHNLDEDAKMPNEYAKIFADYYSNLGGMVGFEGKFDASDFLKTTTINARFGFSNTVFYDSSINAYINTADSGTTYYDQPWLFGVELLFRFATDIETGMKFDDGYINLSMPLYSDCYFDTDFDDRSEYMNWLDYLLSQTDEDDDDSDDISGFTWKLSGAYTPDVIRFNPWITNFSVSSFSSSMVFSSEDIDTEDGFFTTEELADGLDSYSPERSFFYVSSFTPIDFDISIAGDIVKYPSSESKKTAPLLTDEEKEEAVKASQILSSLNLPKNLEEENAENEEPSEIAETSEINEPSENSLDITLPEIAITNPKSSSELESSYSLGWTIKPDFNSNMSYSSDDLTPASTLFENAKYAYITTSVPVKMSSSANIKGGWFSFSNTLDFSPEYQIHPYVSSDYYTDTEKNTLVINDYAEQQISLTNTNSITYKPFISNSIFSKSSIAWNNKMTLLESDFVGSVAAPEWEYNYIGWDEDLITTHNLKMTLAVSLGSLLHSLSVTANLPPQTQSYYSTYKLSDSRGYIKVSSGYDEDDDGDWSFDPFNQSFSYTLFDELKLSESYEYNIEDEYNDSFSFSASWLGLKMSYSMDYQYAKTLNEDEGWISSDEKSFLPDSADISYSTDFKTIINKNKSLTLTPLLSTSLSADLICPTNSSFVFTPSFKFVINDFVSLTFSSKSTNEVLLRYIQSWASNFLWYTLPDISGEENVLIDLFDSFAFWDTSKRENSGFKLSTLSLSVEHNLHDWTLKSEFSVEPRIVTDSTPYYYDFSPYFSLSVVWNPMSSMKTVIEDEYGEFSLNP